MSSAMPASPAPSTWSTSPESTARRATTSSRPAASPAASPMSPAIRPGASTSPSPTARPRSPWASIPRRPIIVAPTNDTIFTALSTAALLAAQQANGALLTHMGELHLGTGSPKVQTALASTTPTQVAFAGTADQLADLLPQIPQAVGPDGRLVQGHRQLRQPRRQHQHPRLRHPGRRLPRRLRQGGERQLDCRRRARDISIPI